MLMKRFRFFFVALIASCLFSCENRNTTTTTTHSTATYQSWEPSACFTVRNIDGYKVTFRDYSKGQRIVYDFGDGSENEYKPEKGKLSLSDDKRYSEHTFVKKMVYTVTVTAYNDDERKQATFIDYVDIK